MTGEQLCDVIGEIDEELILSASDIDEMDLDRNNPKNKHKRIIFGMILVALLAAIGAGIYRIPNTVDVDYEPIEEIAPGRLYTDDMIDPQLPQKEFRSITLNKEAADSLKKNYDMKTMYDCPYTQNGEDLFFEEIYAYQKCFMIYMHENEQGWELKKGDAIQFKAHCPTQTDQYQFMIGLIKNGEIVQRKIVEQADIDDTLMVEQDGSYFYFTCNLTDTDVKFKNIAIGKYGTLEEAVAQVGTESFDQSLIKEEDAWRYITATYQETSLGVDIPGMTVKDEETFLKVISESKIQYDLPQNIP